jgi:hypothetical protein
VEAGRFGCFVGPQTNAASVHSRCCAPVKKWVLQGKRFDGSRPGLSLAVGERLSARCRAPSRALERRLINKIVRGPLCTQLRSVPSLPYGCRAGARNTDLEFRTNRLKLKDRREPYWQRIGPGCQLGFRRLKEGSGTWIAKRRSEGGDRAYEALGAADDSQDANGVDVLSFAQAQEKARAFFTRKAREAAGGFVSTGPYTVADVVQDSQSRSF